MHNRLNTGTTLYRMVSKKPCLEKHTLLVYCYKICTSYLQCNTEII